MHCGRQMGSASPSHSGKPLPTTNGSGRARQWLIGLLMTLMLATTCHASASPRVVLTPQESEWLEAHSVIQVGIFAGNHFPLEAWVAGAPEGLGVDYAKLLASRVGLRLQFRPFTDWEYITLDDAD